MVAQSELENTICPFCRQDMPEAAYDKFRPFAVVRCRGCLGYYLSPRLKESAMLQRYMADDYYTDETRGYADYAAQEKSLRATFRQFMDNLEKNRLTGKTLLEVGCGYGYLLDEAKNFFTYRAGTEFVPQAAEEARRRAEHIYQGGIDIIPPTDIFDCIVATNVIEHIYQPAVFLKQLRSHLTPGGKLVVATPDMGSFWRRFLGHRWPSFKIPEHVLFFDKYSLKNIMQQAGLTKIEPLSFPHAFPLHLIASKLNLPLPHFCANIYLWIPATMIAMYGVNSDE